MQNIIEDMARVDKPYRKSGNPLVITSYQILRKIARGSGHRDLSNMEE
jgi:hypothetical protein